MRLTLMATCWLIRASSARYTSPMPPLPRSRRRRYWPSCSPSSAIVHLICKEKKYSEHNSLLKKSITYELLLLCMCLPQTNGRQILRGESHEMCHLQAGRNPTRNNYYDPRTRCYHCCL